MLLGGVLVTACSSVQVNEEAVSSEAPTAQEQPAKQSSVDSGSVNEAPKDVSPPKPAPKAAPVEVSTPKPSPKPAAAKAEVDRPPVQVTPTPVTKTVKEIKAEVVAEQPAPVVAEESTQAPAEAAKAAAAVATFKASSVPKDTRKWKIEKDWDPQNAKRCKASSPTFQVVEDGYATQVWLNIIANELHVHTTTHVDIKKDRIGVKPSNGTFKPFSSKTSETSAIWSGDIVAAMNSSDTLSIVIGGDGLGDRIHTATVNVTGLKAVYADYVKCKD